MTTYIVVLGFILADIITGFLKAGYMGDINSTSLRKGLFHKASEICATIGAGLLEYGASYIDVKIPLPIVSIVATYICIMELVSVIENLCCVNPQLNKLFKPYLEKLKKVNNENDDDRG